MAKVLVVGAGIAGDTAAVLLQRAGWQVTVAEIAPALRTGGQTVDLRGPSARVLESMGLLQACRRLLVPQRGIRWVDADGRALASMPVEAFGGRGLVSREELLRTDLASVLHAATGAGTTHWFNETVEALEPVAEGVRVTFRHHPREVFDLVIGADGAHSRVRTLAFGPEDAFRRPLGLAHAWFTCTEAAAAGPVDGWFLAHNAPGRRVVEVRPGHPGHLEAGFSFPATDSPARGDRDAQHEFLERTFAGVGWRSPALLHAARNAEDFALDTLDQVDADHWSTQRVVLLGDSAWCASPLSGLGTALALLGAHALAGALAAAGVTGTAEHTDTTQLRDALARYERDLRPTARAAQRLPPGRLATYAPRTRLGIRASAALMRTLQTRPLGPVLEHLAEHLGGHGDDGGHGEAPSLPKQPGAPTPPCAPAQAPR